ncbi:translocation/assembly module TamB domain-containing protein [Caulobacter sp. KR2-114]|uniref:translocation/assembly module TamB domain-containing protein n=1 Tax=Caulobacter sp. KR2-114 TaxID=3400912 RepID=UPI003C08A57A
MSAPDANAPDAAITPGAPPPPRRPAPRAARIAAHVVAWTLLLLLGAVLVARFGVQTPWGRQAVERALDGTRVGRLGHLRLSGLHGDVFENFSVDRLALDDGHGAWAEARNVSMRWSWQALFARRFHATTIAARQLTLIRRPVLGPPSGPSGPAPVSVAIDRLTARVEMLPAFSDQRGVYDLSGGFTVGRRSDAKGTLTALSVLHPGDHLKAVFDVEGTRRFSVDADASEAKGGALAGSLGLAADQPFHMTAHAKGTVSAGQFALLTQVGQSRPLDASGAWTPQGGSATGVLQLAASRLLAGYVHRLGPEVRFDVAGAKAPDRFFTFTLNASAENAKLTARGEADVGRRAMGPQGVDLDLQVVDSNRILSWPKLGPSHFSGRLTGTGAHWGVAGKGEIRQSELMGFSLARLDGPFQLDVAKGQTSLKITAQGDGGAGRGLLAAMLGARPSAAAEIDWLAGNRMLMRRLMVQAPGLKVTGEGDHSLFGGLSFKGDAAISNLAAAHAGAHGLVKASWSAHQDSGHEEGGKPWTISFDAKGESFAAGLGDLDRLMGQTPRLQAKADYKNGVFKVSQSLLDGYAGSLGATGDIGPDAALKLALDWKASGPFEFGPIEVAGAAKGGGSLTGTMNDPRADLKADFAEIDLPYMPLQNAHLDLTFMRGPNATDGRVALAGASPYGPARGAAAFRFLTGGMDLDGIAVDGGGLSASGSLALRRGQASSGDLTLALGPGAFLSQGRADGRLLITDAPGGARAQLSLAATNAALKSGGLAVKTLNLRADGPLMRLPYEVAAEGVTTTGPWKLSGAGVASQFGSDNVFTFQGGGRVRRADFKTLSPAELRFGDRGMAAKAQISLGGGSANIDWRDIDGALNAKAALSNVSLGLLDQDFVGRFDADLDLSGRGKALGGTLKAKLEGAGGRDLKGAQPLSGQVDAALTSNSLTVDAALGSPDGLRSTAHVVLPAETSAAPFRIALVRTRPMSGRFDINGELKPIWDLVMGSERSVSGKVTAQGELRGTLRDPGAVGTLALDNGKFTDAETGLKLQDVTLRAALDDYAVDVSQVSGADGHGGQASGSGRISLFREGDSTFRLNLKAFRLIDNKLGSATASGQATLDRAADGKIRIVGALGIDRADIAANPPIPSGVVPMDVIEINQPVDLTSAVRGPPPREAPVALDVTLKANRGVFVKGRGLDVELSLDAHVTGTTNTPVLGGTARVVRGDYDFAGKRFQFDNRGVIYLGSTAEAIRLDLTATRDDPALTAVIRITGTAAKPKIALTSTPVLPTDEVLSQVLFGSSASQLSSGEAAQLASALSALATGGGFDVVGGLRNFARLDRLAFGSDAYGAATVAGGKYLTDNVYLEVGGGGREGATASIEWRVKKTLSFISRVTRQGDTRLSVRWRKDY